MPRMISPHPGECAAKDHSACVSSPEEAISEGLQVSSQRTKSDAVQRRSKFVTVFAAPGRSVTKMIVRKLTHQGNCDKMCRWSLNYELISTCLIKIEKLR